MWCYILWGTCGLVTSARRAVLDAAAWEARPLQGVCARSLQAEADRGGSVSRTSAVCRGLRGGAPGTSCSVWETAVQAAAVAPDVTAARETSMRKKCVGGMGGCTCTAPPPPLH